MIDRLLKAMLRGLHQALVQNRRQDLLAERLSELAPECPFSLLDVGCGSGEIAANLGARLPGSTIQGVDTLVRPHTKITVQAFDGTTLPFADVSFDYVMLVDVLHHTNDPTGLLAECLRVSRKGVWLKDHLSASLWDYLRLRAMDFVGNWGHGVALPYNYLSPTQWRAAFAQLQVQPRHWRESLSLYPRWLGWLLDDHLHFVTWLEPVSV